MKGKLGIPFLILAFLLIQGCAGVTAVPSQKAPVPLANANLKAVLGENEGLEIVWEDAKDVRDYYRGGVQHKTKAEKKFQEKSYPEAVKFYQSSNDFFSNLLKFIEEDVAEYNLYEGCSVLLFPNLLSADNHYKMGLIQRDTGKEAAAQSSWKRAQSFLNKSLLSEQTEWGLALQKELSGVLVTK
jgi:hypothetical protein